MKNLENEKEYLKALSTILNEGSKSNDRTGVGTIRYPGLSMKFDLQKGFPLLTTKKILFYPMVIELLWFLQGRNDLKWLQDRNCNIWNSWHDEKNTIGKGYGVQWRGWAKGAIHKIDQFKEAISLLKNNPDSRRILVSAWNPSELDQMVLPPCHFTHQYIAINNKLHMIMHQRSGDFFLGIPFNIASYALLLHIVAREVGMEAGTLTHTVGDAHIYSNHVDQVQTQLTREQKEPCELILSDELFLPPYDNGQERGFIHWLDNKVSELTLDEIKKMIHVKDYDSHPFIKAPVAV